MRASASVGRVLRGVALASFVATIVWVSLRDERARKASRAPAAVEGAPTAQVSPPSRERIARVTAQVQAEIDARNQPGREQIELFEKNGWTMADGVAPPDDRLVELDPSLLPARERELQDQIHSNSHEGAALAKLREIALAAGSGKTRWLAIEGLGRSEDPAAQPVLADLYGDLDSANEKSRVLSLMRPDTLDGRVGSFLAGEAANSGLSNELRRQAAAPLVAWAATRPTAEERARAREEVLSRLPEDFRSEVQRMATALERGGGAHSHDSH